MRDHRFFEEGERFSYPTDLRFSLKSILSLSRFRELRRARRIYSPQTLSDEGIISARDLLIAPIGNESPPSMIIGAHEGVHVPFDRGEMGRSILRLIQKREQEKETLLNSSLEDAAP